MGRHHAISGHAAQKRGTLSHKVLVLFTYQV